MRVWEKRLLVLLFVVAGLGKQVQSQNGNPLQFIPEVSQSALSNPAFLNKTDKLVVGLPLISGAWMDWNANFSLDYIFSNNFIYSFDNFYRELGEPGYELGTASIPVLYLSLRSDKQNFTFSVSERIFTESTFDDEILKFIDNGLLPYYGKTEEYGPVSIRAFHYRELAFAYSKQVWEGFSFGFRPKVLFGRFDYEMPDFHFSVQTDTEDEQLLLIPSGNYRIAGPLDVVYSESPEATFFHPNPNITDYFFNFRNLGAALDLGVSYRINNTELSASVTDLGFLTFNYKVYNADFTDALRFDRENLYQSTNPNENNYKEPKIALQELIDSVSYVITVQPATQRTFEPVPAKLNITVKQKISVKTDAGISEQLTYFKGNTQNFITGFMHTTLGERFSLATSISLLDFKKILPGVGASYTAKNAQIYLSTNNITGLVKPSSAKYLNLCFGVNFLFSTYQN